MNFAISVAGVSRFASRRKDAKGRSAAIEILLTTPTIADRLFGGEFRELKAIMAQSRELGRCTFDAALFHLYDEGSISFEGAIRNAHPANELRLNIKPKSKGGAPRHQASWRSHLIP